MPLDTEKTKKEMLRHPTYEEWQRRSRATGDHRELWDEAHGVTRRKRRTRAEIEADEADDG